MLINAQQNHTVSGVTGYKELFAAGFPIHALQLVPMANGDLVWAFPSQRENCNSVLRALEHRNPGTIRREIPNIVEVGLGVSLESKEFAASAFTIECSEYELFAVRSLFSDGAQGGG